MKSINKLKNISLASGAVLAMSLASASALAADVNPFGMTDLSHGYEVVAKEGKCGEGKCGASKKTSSEGKCGEGKCGADKSKSKDKAKDKKSKEGKCGEGKCGAKG